MLNKKKLGAAIASLSAVAVIGAGSTFAFFTSQDKAANAFTLGNLDIDITEDSTSEKATVADDKKSITYADVLPGDVLDKEPVITSNGSADAWVRVDLALDSSDGLTAEQLAEIKDGLVAEMTATGNWAVKDGEDYIYYTSKMTEGDKAALFTEVKIPKTWGNDTAGKNFTIAISAQAVQADNNGDTYTEADWSEDVADFTEEVTR